MRVKSKRDMENKNILEAMLLLAKTLSYSQTYKQCLIDEIEVMLKSENQKPHHDRLH